MTGSARRAMAGFTIVEAMVALVIMAILLSFGMPRMTDWFSSTKAAGAAGFYAEGFTTARLQALSNNSQSRLVFIANAGGQPDWRVDICLRTTDTPCANDGDWSTETAGPKGAAGVPAAFRSIRRSGATLPPATRLAVTLGPGAGSSVYFTPLGWVDTTRAERITRVGLAAPTGQSGAFRPSAVALTLAGVAVTCDPNPAAAASKRCPE